MTWHKVGTHQVSVDKEKMTQNRVKGSTRTHAHEEGNKKSEFNGLNWNAELCSVTDAHRSLLLLDQGIMGL